MDFAPWHAPLVNCRNRTTSEFRQGKVLPTRKPLLLLRLSGWLLLRLAERTFDALLLNEPPRKTRLLTRRPRSFIPVTMSGVYTAPRSYSPIVPA